MAGRNHVAVPLLALLCGLIAIGLSFVANAKRIRVEDVVSNKDGSCMYPSSSAFALGIVAAIFVLAEQIIISVGMGCFCCGRHKFPCNICGIIGFILFILAWLSFVVTFLGLLATAIFNNNSFLGSIQYDRTQNIKDKDHCLKGVRETLFLGAAIWCIINLFFNLTAYATFKCGVHRKRRQNEDRFKGPANLNA